MITTDDPGAPRLLISPGELVRFHPGEGRLQTHRFRSELFFHKSEEGESELRDVLEKAPEASEERMIVFFASAFYGLFPEKLYEEELKTDLFERLFSKSFEKKELRSERSRVSDDRVLYWFPDTLQRHLTRRYPGFSPHPFVLPLQEELFRLHGEKKDASVLAHLRKEAVDIGIVRGKEQLFFNSFPCENNEELLYFLLQSCRRSLKEEDPVHLHVMGCRPLEGNEEELIGNYFSGPHLHIDRENGTWRSPILEPARSHP